MAKAKAPAIINEPTQMVPVDALIPHPLNPRQGDVGAIHESIQANGFYGVVVVQKSTNYVLAGNHRLKAAAAAGMKEVPAILVDVDDDRAKRILLADNRTNDLAAYNTDALVSILTDLTATPLVLTGTGFDGDALDELMADLFPSQTFDQGIDGKYTRKVESPVYEPTGPAPPLSELMDTTKTDELVAQIKAQDLPPELSRFMISAAQRHTVFRYDKVANFYAHADAPLQRLMENSALIVIDYDKAVEDGFVKLNEEVSSLFAEEQPDAG
jgi:hypothetical protein